MHSALTFPQSVFGLAKRKSRICAVKQKPDRLPMCDWGQIFCSHSWRVTLWITLIWVPNLVPSVLADPLSSRSDPTPVGLANGESAIVDPPSGNGSGAAYSNEEGPPSGSFSYSGSPLLNTLVPPNPQKPISGDFFGMTIHHTATQFPPFPVSIFRFWDVAAWSSVEPASGQFVWNRLDDTTNRLRKSGVVDFIFTFGSVPGWASSSPNEPCHGGGLTGTCAAPDMNAFDDFATQLVRRYCGTIKYYETWNEANSAGFWKGSNQQLLTIAQHLNRIAKDPSNCGCSNGVCAPNGGANPNKVLLPSISRINPPNLNWLDSYLSAAGARYPYADIVAFHGYGSPTDAEQIATQVQSLVRILSKHGLSNLPLWNTEGNWGAVPTVGQQQASWLMRYHMAQVAVGVSRLVWYAFDNCGWGILWEAPWCKDPQMPVGQLTDPGRAYGVIENWLVGANLTRCEQYQNGLWACELQRPGGYEAWAVWTSTGASISVPIPKNSGLSVYRDWQNKTNVLSTAITVDQMPLLLESRDLHNLPSTPSGLRK